MREDDGGGGTLAIIFFGEQSSVERLHAQRGKKIVGALASADGFRERSAVTGEICRVLADQDHLLEAGGLLPVGKDAARDDIEGAERVVVDDVAFPQADQTVWPRKGQGTKQDAVDDGEESSVHADAKG